MKKLCTQCGKNPQAFIKHQNNSLCEECLKANAEAEALRKEGEKQSYKNMLITEAKLAKEYVKSNDFKGMALSVNRINELIKKI